MAKIEIDINVELSKGVLDWGRLLEIVNSPSDEKDERPWSCPAEVGDRASSHEPEASGLRRSLWGVNECRTEDFVNYFKFIDALPSYAHEVLWIGMTSLLSSDDGARRDEYLRKIPRIECEGRWSGSICANLIIGILLEEIVRKKEGAANALRAFVESRDEIERPWIALATADHLVEMLGGDFERVQEDAVGRGRCHNELISVKEEFDAFLGPALKQVDLRLLAAYYGLDLSMRDDLQHCIDTGLLPYGSFHYARALIVSRIYDVQIAEVSMRGLICNAVLRDDRTQYWMQNDYHVVSLCVADMMMVFGSPKEAFKGLVDEMRQLVYRATHEYCSKDSYRQVERVGFLLEIAVALINLLIGKGKSADADYVWGIAWPVCVRALYCFHIPRIPFYMAQVLYTYKARDLAFGNENMSKVLLKDLPWVALQNLEKQSVAEACEKTYRGNCR